MKPFSCKELNRVCEKCGQYGDKSCFGCPIESLRQYIVTKAQKKLMKTKRVSMITSIDPDAIEPDINYEEAAIDLLAL